MSELEHLGDALREQLHALVEDLRPSAGLAASVEAITAARPRRRTRERLRQRRLALALPVPIAAIAAAAVIVVGASNPSPSYATAITVLPNGEVRVTLSEISNVAAANAELRRHHIRDMVVVPMTASCPNRNMTYDAGRARPSPVVTLTPRTIPSGSTVVLAAREIGADTVLSAVGRFRDHLPTCTSSHGAGEGVGDLRPETESRPSSRR